MMFDGREGDGLTEGDGVVRGLQRRNEASLCPCRRRVYRIGDVDGTGGESREVVVGGVLFAATYAS